ncbi:hypothetical protein A8W25_02205 [Streptomyces sp. ERV7]|uniref:neutral/alkaline non-lysosomal ceramidase N-terminal domain-containing protein n=1 Tax=Streptomyces sp. ERV7 TaxID=1322334 RepID=UPI0007F4279E|nr:hypothetical protein A8W25_02205 [Streptomyces sp. ERV7]
MSAQVKGRGPTSRARPGRRPGRIHPYESGATTTERATGSGAGRDTETGGGTDTGFLAGRGIADITGEAAECGMLGYGKADQRTAGIHTRRRARAFAFADRAAPAAVTASPTTGTRRRARSPG